MSDIGNVSATSTSSIPDSALPAAIQRGSDADKNTYKTALGFENQLVQQLTTQMTSTVSQTDDSSDDSDDDGAGSGMGDATSQSYTQELPQILAQAVTNSGGLGLAQQLYNQMKATGQ